MVRIDKDVTKGFKSGIGFISALFLFIGILIGVYAFVEPSVGPTVNNVMSQFTHAQASITANNGQYDNRIPEGSFPNNYTEICFKDGTTKYDIHVG
jgi:predicted PurR-regulated permease PerM